LAAKELANHLQMPEPTFLSLDKKGHVKARQVKVDSRSFGIITANQYELEQLRKLRTINRAWKNLSRTEG